jgi:DNA-binding CsgD family transcriptional regulator
MPASTKLNNSWLVELLQAVNAGVSPDSLFRKFAEDISENFSTRSIQVYKFDRMGDLQLAHYFGLQEFEVANFRTIKMASKLPVTDSIRNKSALILESVEEIKTAYPDSTNWVYIPAAIICFPLMSGTLVEGAIVFTLTNSLDEAEFDISEEFSTLRVLGELCQLLVNRLSPPVMTGYERPEYPRIEHLRLSQNQQGQTVELGERHHQLLSLVAQGLTNREIAQKMHYSEATTRVELGKLLAKIGVNNRQEAAAIAHRYGCAD